MNPRPLVARLTGHAGVKRVGGSVDLSTSSLRKELLPRAWIVPMGDKSDGGTPMAEWEERWGVLIAVRNVADTRGNKSMDAVEPIVQAVRARFYDWFIDDTYHVPMIAAGGDYHSFNDKTQVAFWLDEFTAAYLKRPYSPNCRP